MYDFCPFLLAGWIAHYGDYEKTGNVDKYCECDKDCHLYKYTEDNEGCSFKLNSNK